MSGIIKFLEGITIIILSIELIVYICGCCLIYIIIQPFKKPSDIPPVINNVVDNTPSSTPSSTLSGNYFDYVPIEDKLIYFFWAIVIWTFIMYTLAFGRIYTRDGATVFNL
jgi:hypothetical protein